MIKLSHDTEVILSIIAYSLCSGSLVLLNKLILSFIPLPSIVITIQLFSSIFMIYGANMCGLINIDPIKKEYIRPYAIYTVAFSLGVYTNMQCLKSANVETVIISRALSPLIVSFCDFIFLGRELPSRRSLVSLSLIVLGAVGYASQDESFNTIGLSAYLWPFLYLNFITFEMVYAKKIVQSYKFETVSGPVQYTNLMGWPPMLLFASMGGEFKDVSNLMEQYGAVTVKELIFKLPTGSMALMILGCIVGTGIGYSGWWCRNKVSATSYTLIGVINKCLTILVNLLIWDKHAAPFGIFSLFMCLSGGVFYQQAPMRKKDGDDACKAQIEKDLIVEEIEKGDADKDMAKDSLKQPLIKQQSFS